MKYIIKMIIVILSTVYLSVEGMAQGQITRPVKSEGAGKESQVGPRKVQQVNARKQSKFINDYEFVDLGLPSKNKWATKNISAKTQFDFGGYYAWGETYEKTVYSSPSTIYNTNYPSIPTQNDVARAKWGNPWQVPTKADFDELIRECTWIYDESHRGYIATGPNGKSLFFPLSGYKNEKVLYSKNRGGFYMTSTRGYCFDIVSCCTMAQAANLGISVRPIVKYKY